MSRPDDNPLIVSKLNDTPRSIDPDVVEFALVLSRTIDSLEQQPDQMRQALYELARHKLNEQLRGRHGKEFRNARSTLETAIAKVEQFYSEHGSAGEPLRKISSPLDVAERGAHINVTAGVLPPAHVQLDVPKSTFKRTASIALRLVAVLCLIATVAMVLQALRSLGTRSDLQKAGASIASDAATNANLPQSQMPVLDQSMLKPKPLLPSHFGAFAIADGRLTELRLLRGTMPDSRVAISSAIRDESETVLPDGRLKFIVYRRDLPGSMPARAEVRVIARVKKYLASSEQRESAAAESDHWVIRNIAFPYRIAPVQGAPDMYEVESEALDFSLAPGRYALVWKGVGYDFVVAGNASSKHCLEQTTAVNGVFYSECR